MNWVIGLEVPEEEAGAEWVVSQRSSILNEDDHRTGCWRLSSPLGDVEARKGDGDHSYTFPEEPFRIFKLSGTSLDHGRTMQRLTRGRFLVVAPSDWELKTENPGIEHPIAPEYLVGMACRAHHVKLSQQLGAPRVMLSAPDGTQVTVPVAGVAFELDGRIVHDADPDAGPLFCGEPPRLRSPRGIAYRTVVIGEEGPRERSPRWRVSGADFEELRPAIAEKGCGWLFVRLYDQDDRLIDSQDFRFSSQLQSIKIQAGSPMPGPEVHEPALVRVFHGDSAEVVPADSLPQDGLSVRRTDFGSRIEIPPSSGYDETRWLIKQGNGTEVELQLRVNRVWWALADERGERSEIRGWTDRPLALQEDDLAATSRHFLCVQAPPIWRGKDVRVGVELQRSVNLRAVTGHPDTVEVACRELGRFADVEKQAVDLELKLWIRPEGSQGSDWVEAVVVRIERPASEPPVPPPIRLESLNPVTAMRMLTCVRRRHRRFKKEIDELRRTHYRPLRRRRRRESNRAQREAFLREVLCLLALVIEEWDAAGESPWVLIRWVRRAELARTSFPQIYDAIKRRSRAGTVATGVATHRGEQ